MHRLDPQTMENIRQPRMLEDYLGPLAPYLLDAPGMQPPRPPRRRGVTPVLLTLGDELREHDLLHDGFVLPLQWREGERDSPRLPPKFHEVADSARVNVRDALPTDIGSWRLTLPGELDGADLSELPVQGTSMWAPLVAGLVIAATGGVPRPHVFATGAWSGHGIEPVADVDAKIRAVHRCFGGADDPGPVVFVPADNANAAREAGGDAVAVRKYEPAVIDLNRLFEDHLRLLDAPPARTAELDERLAYVNRPYLEKPEVSQYCLKRGIAVDLAQRFRHRFDEPVTAGRLVLTLGFSPELPAMLLHALRPERVVIVHSPKNGDTLDELCTAMRDADGFDGDIDSRLFDGPDVTELVAELADWLREEPDAKRRVVDITGGTASMTAAVTLAAKETAARVLYVEHDYDGGPVIGSESPRTIWRGNH